jgi:hypothetical protein
VTSGAMNSIDALTFKVSGVPLTSPDPTTVTWRTSESAVDPVGPGAASQPDSVTASPAAARTRSRVDNFALAAIGMTGTIPSGLHQNLAMCVRLGEARIRGA